MKQKIPVINLNKNLLIPIIGLGTWKLKGKVCIEIVKKALELGYKHIDTAEVYLNEEAIGDAIKKSNIQRNDLFITSKIWPENLNYYKVLASCEQSLARLGTYYLDQYLLHWPNKKLDYLNIFKAFMKLYELGKIKSFGVSNFTINHLRDAITICKKLKLPLTVNQVEFHPFLYQENLLDFCKKNKIKIVAYSPLAQGRIFENSELLELGNKYNKNPSQITLRWLVSKEIIVIPKASSEKHLRENIDIFNFELSKKNIKEIDNLNKYERLIDPLFSEFDY